MRALRGGAGRAGAPARRDERRGEHGAPGVFPYHCHILEHEDGGMMGS
jgi:hypothetical protein